MAASDVCVRAKKLIKETAISETALKTDRSKMLIACTINLLAVSTVFMTQPIFLELSESFKIDITEARFSFKIVSFVLFFLSALTFFSLVEKHDEKSESHQKLIKLYANSMRLFLNPKILSLLLAGFTLFVGFLGMVTFLTYRLTGPPFYFTSGEVGWISFAGITALIAPFAGNLSQKLGRYRIIFSAILICLLSFQLMGWFESVPLTTLGLLLLFLGVYTFQPILFLIVGQNVPKASLGSASSLYILFCIGGGSLSSIFLGPVWRSYGWHGATMLCSVSLLISLLIMSVIALKDRGQKGGY